MDEKFNMFMETVDERFHSFVNEINEYLTENDCNPKCIMGYTFVLDGEQYQKCRYMAFQPTLSEENNPYIKQFLEKEFFKY